MNDLISIQMEIEHWGRSSGNLTNDQIAELQREIESLPSAEPKEKRTLTEDDYHYCEDCNACEVCSWYPHYGCEFKIAEPKTGRDCTEFVRWLMDEVMDEENWQMNAVANGEIICRKLKKLGLLDVVDGYYVETQKTGEWVRHELWDAPWYTCSECDFHGRNDYKFCPNCGARMNGDDE